MPDIVKLEKSATRALTAVNRPKATMPRVQLNNLNRGDKQFILFFIVNRDALRKENLKKKYKGKQKIFKKMQERSTS
ncbi:hypothetical protein C1N51_12155 [Vibrio campbellii]|nr:hypothetical protein C1N51_12155 [Vibrio campbellii]